MVELIDRIVMFLGMASTHWQIHTLWPQCLAVTSIVPVLRPRIEMDLGPANLCSMYAPLSCIFDMWRDITMLLCSLLKLSKFFKFGRRKKEQVKFLTGNPTVLAKMDIWLFPTLKFAGFSNSKDFSSWVPWLDPYNHKENYNNINTWPLLSWYSDTLPWFYLYIWTNQLPFRRLMNYWWNLCAYQCILHSRMQAMNVQDS